MDREEVIEMMAREIALDKTLCQWSNWIDIPSGYKQVFLKLARKLLDLKHKCPVCKGQGKFGCEYDYIIGLTTCFCSACKGSGYSDLPVMAIVAENQGTEKLQKLFDEHDFRNCIEWDIYDQAITDMTTPDKDGYVWRRVRV